VPFENLEIPVIARALAQLMEQPEDLADLYLERLEEIELPPEDASPGLRVRRESGLAVRLLRGNRSWLAGRDTISPESFNDALRRVVRTMPRLPFPHLDFRPDRFTEPPEAEEVLLFPGLFQQALRAHRLDLAGRLRVRRYRRWVKVISPQQATGVENENFYELRFDAGPVRVNLLLSFLDELAADQLARAVLRAHRAKDAEPVTWRGPCVLGPAAVGVLLHEAVAHALEADILAQGGHPEAAVGVRLGSPLLHIYDDPTSAPPGVRRAWDDEGFPTIRRYLVRGGLVEQPIADAYWARRSDFLVAGSGRRGDRHEPPGPRSSHLELLPGELGPTEINASADGGLYFPEVERGRLDPLTGELTLRFPYGLRLQDQTPGAPVGPCTLRGRIADLLERVTGIGREVRSAGAGWCAKDGLKMPVWASAPEVLFDQLEILP
jgi:PmbA/TldA metallopeptidase C-terminal domain